MTGIVLFIGSSFNLSYHNEIVVEYRFSWGAHAARKQFCYAAEHTTGSSLNFKSTLGLR